jgi:hypothetical protein
MSRSVPRRPTRNAPALLQRQILGLISQRRRTFDRSERETYGPTFWSILSRSELKRLWEARRGKALRHGRTDGVTSHPVIHRHVPPPIGRLAGTRSQPISCEASRSSLGRDISSHPPLAQSFNSFFSRRLKANARPIDCQDDKSVIVSPADCRLTVWESVDMAKRFWYVL